MKKFLLPIFSLCFIGAMVFICGTAGGESTNTNSSSADKADRNVISIGVFEPLTGDDAQEGLQETLAVRYANFVCPTVEINGVKYDIELNEQDNASDIGSAASSAKSLADSKVSAVLGSYGSWLTAQGAKALEKENIPVVGITCSSRLLVKNSNNFFRVCSSDSFQSGAAASYAYSISCRKAAVLSQIGDLYSKDSGKLISDAFKNQGGTAYSYRYQKGQQNFRSLVQDIMSGGADCVIMSSGPAEAAYFISQARELGLNCPIIGPESWDTSAFLNASSESYGEVFVLSEFSENSVDPVSAKFASDYSAWLNSDKSRIAANGGSEYVSPAAALGYDSYMLVVKALSSAKSADPKVLMKAIKEVSFSGLSGEISFAKDGESQKKFTFIKKLDSSNKSFDVLQSSSSGR